MELKTLNDAPDAASYMIAVLKKSIAELERQTELQRVALKACEAVAGLPKIETDFKKPADRGKDVLKRAMEAVGGAAIEAADLPKSDAA